MARPPLIIPRSPELVREAENLKSEFATLEVDSKASETKIRTTSHDENEIERRIAKVKRAIEEELKASSTKRNCWLRPRASSNTTNQA